MSDFTPIKKKLAEIERFIRQEAPHIVGTEAVNHFTESFENQGFTDTSLKKWPDVKRRDPSSSWYGFHYGSRTKVPSNHPRRKGTKRKYKPRKENPITNYRKAATKTPVLSSQRSRLERSLSYKARGMRITVVSNEPHAEVHNKGGSIKVFGRTKRRLPKRQFMGPSRKLKQNITKEFQSELRKIIR